MGGFIVAVPALLPILGGVALLLFHLWETVPGSGVWKKRLGGVSRQKRYRALEWYIGSLTLLNSLIIAGIVLSGRGGSEPFVLFYLYGELRVLFCLDRMGSVFACLIAFLWPLAVLYSFEYMRKEERTLSFFAFYLMTYGVTAGIAFSGNLLTLYLFYELLTIVTFPLVLFPLTKEAVRASRTYLYYSIGGAAFAFLGLIFVLSNSTGGTTRFLPGGVLDPLLAAANRRLLLAAYCMAFFGFGVKAALFPCSGWLPKATVAPTPVTALLHAVAVVKSGAFAILRLTYFSFGISFLKGSPAQWLVLCAAGVTILFGSTMAVREAHWKRRLAYSTVSNLSYILLGAAMMSPLGLVAALSHLVFHAFMKICSFFCAGAVMHQSGKTYVYQLDGMAKKMPVTFGCLAIASLSLIGIPPFAGFISKWNIAAAAFDCGSAFSYAGAAVLLYSALMTAVYMLTVLVRAYFPQAAERVQEKTGSGQERGGKDEKENKITDPGFFMLLPLVIFAAAILLFGLHSEPLMGFLREIGGEIG